MEMRARASGNEKIGDLLNKSKSRLKEAIYLGVEINEKMDIDKEIGKRCQPVITTWKN